MNYWIDVLERTVGMLAAIGVANLIWWLAGSRYRFGWYKVKRKRRSFTEWRQVERERWSVPPQFKKRDQ